MKTACIYHSIDLDGYMSAAIVKHWWLENSTKGAVTGGIFNETDILVDIVKEDSIIFIGYNYGQHIPDLSKYDKVIMCDISFPKEEMLNLWATKGLNFIWIDHHISAIKDMENAHENISSGAYPIIGLRDTKFSACELTWFHMNNPINNAAIDLTSFNRYKEKWVDIDSIYSISNYGRVLSKEREVNHVGGKAYRPNKILKHIIDANGYSRVTINGVSEKVHKLVAKYFLNSTGETVNHIDGNKENNCVSNLEYASYKENNIHAIENRLRNSGFEHWQSKIVEQYKDGKLINTFGSTNEAAKETGISQGNIAAVCRYHQGIKSKFRNRTQAGGYVFKYKNEVKEEIRFERSKLKRTINIGSILSQSNSLELDNTEKEIHKFFNTPEIVRLLGRYDCFGSKGTYEETKVLEFQYGARQCISNYEEAYCYLLKSFEGVIQYDYIGQYTIEDKIQKQGKSIYQYLCTEAKQAYKNGFEIKFMIESIPTNEEIRPIPATGYCDICGKLENKQLTRYYFRYENDKCNCHSPYHFDVFNCCSECKPVAENKVPKNFICINKERFNPINFGIDYHKDGYDGCACFHFDGTHWCFSLYNDNGLVDCSQIAKQYGGGGHKYAAGMIVDLETFKSIVQL